MSRAQEVQRAFFALRELGLTEVLSTEGVFEGTDPEELARRLGYPFHFGMKRDQLWNAITGLADIRVAYRPWTFRVVKNMPDPYLILFSHEADAVHFRLLA